MPRKDNKFIFKHQFKLKPRHVDSFSQTVPDLVMSMRDVYHRYVQFGTVDGIAVKPLIQDDREMDDLPEETVDTLLLSSQLRDDALHELEDQKKKEKPEEKPEDETRDILEDLYHKNT